MPSADEEIKKILCSRPLKNVWTADLYLKADFFHYVPTAVIHDLKLVASADTELWTQTPNIKLYSGFQLPGGWVPQPLHCPYIYLYLTVLFRHRKCCHLRQYEWTWRTYAKWDNSDTRKRNTVCYHLCVKSKRAKLIKQESRMMVTRGWRVG